MFSLTGFRNLLNALLVIGYQDVKELPKQGAAFVSDLILWSQWTPQQISCRLKIWPQPQKWMKTGLRAIERYERNWNLGCSFIMVTVNFIASRALSVNLPTQGNLHFLALTLKWYLSKDFLIFSISQHWEEEIEFTFCSYSVQKEAPDGVSQGTVTVLLE